MKIGMVLANDKETIVPIVEGQIARIYDTETEDYTDSPNPALGLVEGRRGATVKWMLSHGVKVLCSPPGMLCELSYSKAQEEKLTFYRLAPETKFSVLISQLNNGIVGFSDSLPNDEIEPSAPPTNKEGK